MLVFSFFFFIRNEFKNITKTIMFTTVTMLEVNDMCSFCYATLLLKQMPRVKRRLHLKASLRNFRPLTKKLHLLDYVQTGYKENIDILTS